MDSPREDSSLASKRQNAVVVVVEDDVEDEDRVVSLLMVSMGAQNKNYRAQMKIKSFYQGY